MYQYDMEQNAIAFIILDCSMGPAIFFPPIMAKVQTDLLTVCIKRQYQLPTTEKKLLQLHGLLGDLIK